MLAGGGERCSTLASQPMVVDDLGGSASRGSTRAECTVQSLMRTSGGAGELDPHRVQC